jgi:hypothetical protein
VTSAEIDEALAIFRSALRGLPRGDATLGI